METSVIKKFSDSYNPGINEIKLRELLALRHNELKSDYIHTTFPPMEIGSITLVDQVVLLLLERLVAPNTILEIGTYFGYTTNLFLKNSIAKVISIDLPKLNININTNFETNLIMSDGNYNDDYLRVNQEKNGEIYLEKITAEERFRLKLVKADSTKISFIKSFGKLEYIFIDGGHSYDIVKSDTLNARKAISEGVIIWHDYSSLIHSDVTKFLAEESKCRKIFHVKGSLCAFEFI